jgi:hypothetical protein
MRAKGYQRIVVKAQIGASGIGMLMLDAEQPAIDQVPETFVFRGTVFGAGLVGRACGRGPPTRLAQHADVPGRNGR